MRFDHASFQMAIHSGGCCAPRVLSPLYRLSREALALLDRQMVEREAATLHEHYQKLSERMTDVALGDLRMATALAWRGADGYFPAYRYHVGEFVNDDWLSSVDWHKKFHRDHISHQAMCYWVAQRLLDTKDQEVSFDTSTLRERCLQQVVYDPECHYLRDYAERLGVFKNVGRELKTCLWASLFDEAVFLATMYHDIGYPWQFVQGIATQLSGNSALSVMPMQMSARELYDAYGTRLLCYPFQNYSAPAAVQPAGWRRRTESLLLEGLSRTHGLPGALAFLYLNDVLRQFPDAADSDAKGLFCIEWAALAILMHDLQRLYVGKARNGAPPENSQLRISFRRDPLSFLLTLVDQIQDFCRPNAVFKATAGAVKLEYEHACHAVEITAQPRQPVRIVYCYEKTSDYDKNTAEHKPKAEREFFDPTVGYVDWSGLPISSIWLRTRHEPESGHGN
jgi:hypothetical protein